MTAEELLIEEGYPQEIAEEIAKFWRSNDKNTINLYSYSDSNNPVI